MRMLIASISLLFSVNSLSIELYTDFPETINADESYVFYSHGKILEGSKNNKPKHESYGIYAFPEIKKALFSEGDFNLIAHHRAVKTDIYAYADVLVGQVEKQLDAGVKHSNITIIGFSNGSYPTALASDKLSSKGINTVLLASCLNENIAFEKQINLGGNVLTVYETTDVMGSCGKLKHHSSNAISFQEFSISTGLRHGAFFQPLADWVNPLKRWIAEKHSHK